MRIAGLCVGRRGATCNEVMDRASEGGLDAGETIRAADRSIVSLGGCSEPIAVSAIVEGSALCDGEE